MISAKNVDKCKKEDQAVYEDGFSSLKDQSDYFTRLFIWSYSIFRPGEI